MRSTIFPDIVTDPISVNKTGLALL